MSDDDEDAFNMESSAATAELESVLRSEAIGDTLYDRRWVLKTVMAVASNTDYEDEDDLCSLTDMTAERDVCAFLVESGCAEVFLGIMAESRPPKTREMGLKIAANVISHVDGFGESNAAAWEVPVGIFFEAEEAGVLTACLACFGSMAKQLSKALEEEDETRSKVRTN